MLRDLLEIWPAEVTIIPNSAIQFLDFGFNLDEIAKGTMEFSERRTSHDADVDVWQLIPHLSDDDPDQEIPEPLIEGEEDYSISKVKAFEPFLNKWTPIPVLRLHLGRGPNGEEIFDGGPSTWARIYITELDDRNPETGETHRVIIALDTDLEDDEEEIYLAPRKQDAIDQREFKLVSDPKHNAWFLRHEVTDDQGQPFDQQKWVDEWLREQFLDLKRAQRPNREPKPEDFPYRFEHWARYLAMLRLIGMKIEFPRLKLIDTISDDRHYQCVDVDLILDVGNSRTCGILVESYPDDSRIDLNNSFALAMRDLGRPELYARKPFESRVEFAETDFGPDHLARRSGRARPAFLWPSMVRIGMEAQRLSRQSKGTETVSGISSPKRYIWDTTPVTQNWRFNGDTGRQTLPLIARSSFRFLNEAGDVVEQIQVEEDAKIRKRGESSKTGAIHPRFSRSSLYGFMLSELITHALVQINDPGGRAIRKQSSLPRRLRNIILTLPSATPVQEQAIMRSRAEGALRLVWAVMGWKGSSAVTCQVPNILIDWDEASCTQLVWLYDEIALRFGGQISSYLKLKGKARKRPAETTGIGSPAGIRRPEDSLRVGCIDIGGGTTDLMITTYYSEDNRALLPYQNVREGFRVAGDDLVAEVISRIILPQVRDQLADAGVSYAEEMIRDLFSGDVGDVAEQVRQRRRQFGLQVLIPTALATLQIGEHLEAGTSKTLKLADALPQLPALSTEDPDEEPTVRLAIPDEILGYLEQAANQRGAEGWSLASSEILVSAAEIEDVVNAVLGQALEAMIEVATHLDVDQLLLSGRPSRLRAVRDFVRDRLACRPDKLVAMHDYQIGGWYPYRDRVSSRIADPKTTAAVGAMLCLLASNRIVNFKLHTENIRMCSTARIIGVIERNGQLLDERVLFRDVDLDQRGRGEESAKVLLRSPMHIGFRQVPFERWMASPLYRLDFANEQAQRRPTPLQVTLKRRELDLDPENPKEAMKAEVLKEAFAIEEVEDAEGAGCKTTDVSLKLHTLGVDEIDYWLDSGVFKLD